MQVTLAEFVKNTHAGDQAAAIIKKCVHCGFCNATCPTYQLLGDELDGPRGRIYQIKQVLEGHTATRNTQLHLDRCLTCLNCETTCPSGVAYGELLDIGRKLVEQQVKRNPLARVCRLLLRKTLTQESLFRSLLGLGRLFKPMLPKGFSTKIPKTPASPKIAANDTSHSRKMLLLRGCVQPTLSPNINAASKRVFASLGIELLEISAGCCGAVDQHLSATKAAQQQMRNNIDAWWPHIEAGAEAVVMTASGCGALVKRYGELLAHDKAYAAKAEKVSELCKDISELVSATGISHLKNRIRSELPRISYHSPCSLQHALKQQGQVESLLQTLGFKLNSVVDSHLCCGSAGSYSILQAALAKTLRNNKLKSLEQTNPEVIATANIGCLHHLQSGTATPVYHWIELVDTFIS